jgi:hypothetical protein
MPTPTYLPLANITLGSATASVTFSSIPATYRDLVVVINGAATAASNSICRFNGDTGSNYNEVLMLGFSGGTFSVSLSNRTSFSQLFMGTARTTNVFQIMDYSATDKHKTTLLRMTEGGISTNATAGRFASSSAINQILFDLEDSGVNYLAGTTFDLYGIAS